MKGKGQRIRDTRHPAQRVWMRTRGAESHLSPEELSQVRRLARNYAAERHAHTVWHARKLVEDLKDG